MTLLISSVMPLLLQKDAQAETKAQSEKVQVENQREQIKQELRQSIYAALHTAKDLPPEQCLHEIRRRLFAIQQRCATVGKTFIAIEETITCDQYDLGGYAKDSATLFRGPNVEASVAICVTHKGSLLHRNSSVWQVYKDMGDIRIEVNLDEFLIA